MKHKKLFIDTRDFLFEFYAKHRVERYEYSSNWEQNWNIQVGRSQQRYTNICRYENFTWYKISVEFFTSIRNVTKKIYKNIEDRFQQVQPNGPLK